jgi:hypothetical protein
MSADAISRPGVWGANAAYWIATSLFGLLMAFAAFAYLTQPAMAQAFTHLGLPPYLRVELALAKLLGVAALLAPVPPRVKEWAYAGFTINLVSATIAHAAVDGLATAAAPVIVALLLLTSYVAWRRR